MNGPQAIQAALESTKGMLNWYLADFTDADLLVRPVPGANHAAWQIGNIIGGDVLLLQNQSLALQYPTVPEGFFDLHGRKGATNDGPAGFLTKDEYLKLFNAVREVTIRALDKLTDADLDRPTIGDVQAYAPTLGKLFLMVSDHTTMHTGQFTVIRRKLGKPVLF